MTHELRKEIYAALDEWRGGGINSTQFVNGVLTLCMEEAARVCAKRETHWKFIYETPGAFCGNEHVRGLMDGAAECTELIRALATPEGQ